MLVINTLSVKEVIHFIAVYQAITVGINLGELLSEAELLLAWVSLEGSSSEASGALARANRLVTSESILLEPLLVLIEGLVVHINYVFKLIINYNVSALRILSNSWGFRF